MVLEPPFTQARTSFICARARSQKVLPLFTSFHADSLGFEPVPAHHLLKLAPSMSRDMTQSSLANRISPIRLASRRPGDPNSSALQRPRELSGASGGREDVGDHTMAAGAPNSAPTIVLQPFVEISPPNVVTRQSLTGQGVTVESVSCMGRGAVTCRFHASRHLLVAYEQSERTSGETFVKGAPSSRLRNPARRLIFVPAGHEYQEQYDSRTATHLTFVYLDPKSLRIAADTVTGDTSTHPQLLFEDSALWHLVMRLKGLLEDTSSRDPRYPDAIGIVLVHELVRCRHDASAVQLPPRGGLAGWQQRTVTTYIEVNFGKRISLATLARLVRLSRWHFCRAFKQSFGMPPLLYLNERRIEHAKRLLANRELSVMEIGLQVGFVTSSAFATAFRKATGVAPRAYARSL